MERHSEPLLIVSDESGVESSRPSTAPTHIHIPVVTVPVGTKIDRYELHGALGTGTFGQVYLAYDPSLDRRLAIKVPRASSQWNDLQKSSFLQEARLTAQLKHPHVVSIYDVGADNGHGIYLAMEYVSGQPLKQRLKQGPLDWREACELLARVCDAVHAAHVLKIIHRDLKPGNILLDEQGSPKVADFGLAVLEDQQSARSGEVLGTPAYMSPEQFRGEVHYLDGRSDIWSLGVILYECLTGHLPFREKLFDRLKDEVQNRPHKPLRQFNDQLPAAVVQICDDCLNKTADERPQTASDVARRLRAAMAPPRQTSRWMMAAAAVMLVLASWLGRDFFTRRVGATSSLATVSVGPSTSVLPLAALEPLTFVSDEPLNHFSYDRANQRFAINTRHWAAFGWDAIQPDSFDLEVTATVSSDAYLFGVIWDRQPGPTDQPGYHWAESCRAAYFLADHPSGQGSTVCLERLVFAGRSRATSTLSGSHSGQVVPVAADRFKPITLEVSIRQRRLTRLRLQGQEIDVDVDPEADLTRPAGLPGVVCSGGQFVITQLNLISREPS